QTKTSPISIILETAHPGKFPEEIKKILNIEPETPKSLSGLENKKETFENISSNYKEFKRFLQDKF
ncbi:threonine synthase, partial [Patescibacteria group bacterium]|nr:threonine synthase [Patescibacteria group bacterium]